MALPHLAFDVGIPRVSGERAIGCDADGEGERWSPRNLWLLEYISERIGAHLQAEDVLCAAGIQDPEANCATPL
jgi:hypothetical protein